MFISFENYVSVLKEENFVDFFQYNVEFFLKHKLHLQKLPKHISSTSEIEKIRERRNRRF
ncbi:MAG: hypothetical protein N2Z58_07120 [Fervidobacterium sp.]|nr:hypothetical protein [Fervidobacterium sp.]